MKEKFKEEYEPTHQFHSIVHDTYNVTGLQQNLSTSSTSTEVTETYQTQLDEYSKKHSEKYPSVVHLFTFWGREAPPSMPSLCMSSLCMQSEQVNK